MQRKGSLWGRIAAPKLRQAEPSGLQKTAIEKTSTRRSSGSRLQQAGRSLLRWLSGNAEPRVWQTCDRQGHTTWHLYDPITQATTQFGSEAEVRAWLEQRYYQPYR